MARLTSVPRYLPASAANLARTMEEISSGAKTLSTPLMLTWMYGLVSLSMISKGNNFLSDWTDFSL